MFRFNINTIMQLRQIDKPYTFLIKAGFTQRAASHIVNNRQRMLKLDQLEKLCLILNCEPNDLLVYKPKASNPLPENHALKKLLPKETNLDWQQDLKMMPVSELREIGKLITPKEL